MKRGEKSGKLGNRGGKSGSNREKEEKSGRKGKNQEGSFNLPLLTDRAGYTILFRGPYSFQFERIELDCNCYNHSIINGIVSDFNNIFFDLNRKILTKKVISKISVDSNFAFTSYARLIAP